ncbi:Optic atrophy 3 protein [Polyrhizophydium stewartii]|uniref:Optic atrophy 3 protein n=1 Tax=Polyrhizophydium stewartii TaxID=2732419 RepID=A0ABR4MYD5_9FUNG
MATAKVGSLLIRTLSKPLANTIKANAKTYHRLDMGLKMRFLDFKSVEPIRPLNDARAVELGADFISESILFLVAALTIIGETWRSSRNTKKRNISLDDSVERLEAQTGENQARIEELSELVGALRREIAELRQETRPDQAQAVLPTSAAPAASTPLTAALAAAQSPAAAPSHSAARQE